MNSFLLLGFIDKGTMNAHLKSAHGELSETITECAVGEEVVVEIEEIDNPIESSPGAPQGSKSGKKYEPEDPQMEEMLRDLNLLQCQLCDANLPSMEDLSTHFMDVHKNRVVYIICCGLKFFNRRESYDHMQYHLNEDAFKCAECGLRAMCGSKLRKHKYNVHERRFKCKKCRSRFKLASQLDYHMRTHADPKRRPVKCKKREKRE